MVWYQCELALVRYWLMNVHGNTNLHNMTTEAKPRPLVGFVTFHTGMEVWASVVVVQCVGTTWA